MGDGVTLQGRRGIQRFLALALATYDAQPFQFFERVADDMGVFDIERKTDIGQFFAALTVVYVMQHNLSKNISLIC